MKGANVHGRASWSALDEAFRSVLDQTRGGAAFCAIADGRVVASLSGGWTDRAQTASWRADTTVTVFSGSKGLVSMCLAILVDRGQLDLDAPVCRYWPEFAAAGKSDVTVRDVATHRAGLPALAVMPSVAELADPARPTAMLAEQAPHPRLRRVPSYHALTFGWLCGEIVRRVVGVSLGEFFRREIAEPAHADVRFGVPGNEQARVAELFAGRTWGMPAPRFEPEYARRIIGESELWTGDDLAWNRAAVRAAEIPGAGAIGTAEGMARCYAAFTVGLDGRPPLVSSETLARFAEEQYEATDPCSDAPLRYGVGFQLQAAPHFFFGPPLDAFGHGGAGGSLHGWWPSERVAVSFAMNEMREETADRRARDLLAVLHGCLVG